jgi:hypothetical protein
MFWTDGAILRYIRTPTQPLVQAPTLKTQGQATGIQTTPHTKQKQEYKSTRRKPMGKNTHWHTSARNWQKGHANKKNKKTYIYFYHQPNLNFIPNFNIPKTKNFNILIFSIQYVSQHRAS